jgi:hypothetical protein
VVVQILSGLDMDEDSETTIEITKTTKMGGESVVIVLKQF